MKYSLSCSFVNVPITTQIKIHQLYIVTSELCSSMILMIAACRSVNEPSRVSLAEFEPSLHSNRAESSLYSNEPSLYSVSVELESNLVERILSELSSVLLI